MSQLRDQNAPQRRDRMSMIEQLDNITNKSLLSMDGTISCAVILLQSGIFISQIRRKSPVHYSILATKQAENTNSN